MKETEQCSSTSDKDTAYYWKCRALDIPGISHVSVNQAIAQSKHRKEKMKRRPLGGSVRGQKLMCEPWFGKFRIKGEYHFSANGNAFHHNFQ
jgi:hypothetical protein